MNTVQQPLDFRNRWVWVIPLLAVVAMLLLWLSQENRSLFLYLNAITGVTGSALWVNITTLGDTLVLFSLALLLVKRYPLLIWNLFLAGIIVALIIHGLKEWLLVMRPPYYFGPDEINIVGKAHIAVSFPSGHTSAIFALVGIIAMQVEIASRWKWLLFGVGLLVGLSRIAVGVHWPMDVLGGIFFGYLSGVAAVLLAPLIPWGISIGAQRLFAALLLGAAIALLLFHDSGYPQARFLEMTIAAVAILLSLSKLKQLFTRTEEERAIAAQFQEEALASGEKGPSLIGIVIRVAITVAIFVLIFRNIDIAGVTESIRNVVPRLLLLGLVFQLLSTLLASWRWYLVMHQMGFGQNFPFYMRSYFKGTFFNQGLPTSIGGDAIRVLDVARLGHRKREAFYGVAIDRGLGLVGLLLLNLLANALEPDLLPHGVFLTINTLVILGLVGFVVLYGLRRIDLLKRWQITRLFHHISRHLAQVLSDWRSVGIQLSLSLAIHLFSIIAIFLIGRSVEMEFDLLTFAVIVPPVILLTLIPVSLAGWGVREGAMIGLFTLIGADKTVVLSMSILYGVVLIVSSLPGLHVYLAGRHRI